MTELPLPQRVGKTAGGWGCLFYWDACGIEGMVREKMISSSFGGATGPELQTPSANKPWVSARQVGLQTHGVGAALDTRARPACMAIDLGERVWKPAEDAWALGPASGLDAVGPCIKTQVSRVLCRDLILLGPLSGPMNLGSFVLGIWFINIIICVINIIIFLIIQSIYVKKLLFVLSILLFLL
jgi:hypothetical protein